MQGLDELVRGGLGVLIFAGLFLAARWRFAEKGAARGPADNGLD